MQATINPTSVRKSAGLARQDLISEQSIHYPDSTLIEAVSAYATSEGQQYIRSTSRRCKAHSYYRFQCCRNRCRQRLPVHMDSPSQVHSQEALAVRRHFFDGKDTGCPAKLVVYAFIGTPGYYVSADPVGHNHESHHSYLNLTTPDRAHWKAQFQQNPNLRVSDIIQDKASHLPFNSEHDGEIEAALDPAGIPRSELLQPRELYRIKAQVLKKRYALAHSENASVALWREKMADGRLLLYRARSTDTPFQLAFMSRMSILLLSDREGVPSMLAKAPISIDATYNTTKNPKMLLYTIVSRDPLGHGYPLAHLLSDSKEAAVIATFLNAVCRKYPQWKPPLVLTDVDNAQIRAIKDVFLGHGENVEIRLCSWHVLERWRKHIKPPKVRVRGTENQFEQPGSSIYKSMYKLMKGTSIHDFERRRRRLVEELRVILRRQDVSNQAPTEQADFEKATYLMTYYLNDTSTHPPAVWAHCFRKEDSVCRQMDTTMLSESYHNVLKHTLLRRRRLNRMDSLLYVLLEASPSWYGWMLCNQAAGRDLANYQHRNWRVRDEVQTAKSFSIPGFDIVMVEPNIFDVPDMDAAFSAPGSYCRVSLPLGIESRIPKDFTCNCQYYRKWMQSYDKCQHIHAAIRARASLGDSSNTVSTYNEEHAEEHAEERAEEEAINDTIILQELRDLTFDISDPAEGFLGNNAQHPAMEGLPSEPSADDFVNQLLEAGVQEVAAPRVIGVVQSFITVRYPDCPPLPVPFTIESGNVSQTLPETETSRAMRPKRSSRLAEKQRKRMRLLDASGDDESGVNS